MTLASFCGWLAYAYFLAAALLYVGMSFREGARGDEPEPIANLIACLLWVYVLARFLGEWWAGGDGDKDP